MRCLNQNQRDSRAVEGGMAVPAVLALVAFSNSAPSWTAETVSHTGGTPVPPSLPFEQDYNATDSSLLMNV
jgi:hypothetical protein